VLKNLTQTVAIPIIDAAVDLAIPDSDPRKPLFKAVWYSVRGSYGFLAAFMPEEAEDFMKQIGEHRDKIATELLRSKEFEQALIITFDTLILTRSEKKRSIVKRVFFKGYIPSKKHDEFELERFYQTSQLITLKAADYLRFIKREIYPRRQASIDAKLKATVKDKAKDIKRVRDLTEYLFSEIDSNHIRAYIKEKFNTESPKIKQKHSQPKSEEDIKKAIAQNLLNSRKEDEHLRELEENAAELNSLGIFRTIPTFDYTGYILTDFGHSFISYLNKN
jgi:hypothetical protein